MSEAKYASGKTVLLTGAGGSIGSALARSIGYFGPKRLILLDKSAEGLEDLDARLRPCFRRLQYEIAIGDICDARFVAELFERLRPDSVYHAAALKDVPLMEANPVDTVRTNTIATHDLARLACDCGVKSFTLISTDKAANARSIMGASKRMAELAVLRWKSCRSQMCAIRLGNVMWSRGSVLPLFRDQILAGGPVTVTHPEVTRYFMTIEEAVNSTLQVAEVAGESGLFIPDLREPKNILQLATRMIKESSPAGSPQIPIQFIGLRPGDKLTEDMVSAGETLEPVPNSDLLRIVGSPVSPSRFDCDIQALRTCVERSDVSGTLGAVLSLVPEYVQSDSVLALAARLAA